MLVVIAIVRSIHIVHLAVENNRCENQTTGRLLAVSRTNHVCFIDRTFPLKKYILTVKFTFATIFFTSYVILGVLFLHFSIILCTQQGLYGIVRKLPGDLKQQQKVAFADLVITIVYLVIMRLSCYNEIISL